MRSATAVGLPQPRLAVVAAPGSAARCSVSYRVSPKSPSSPCGAQQEPPPQLPPSPAETARAAYADFQRAHAEVLALSRRNSNVRSLAISLGQKRKVMAQCQEHLNALREAVRMRFEATR